jgi:hypothetical protein
MILAGTMLLLFCLRKSTAHRHLHSLSDLILSCFLIDGVVSIPWFLSAFCLLIFFFFASSFTHGTISGGFSLIFMNDDIRSMHGGAQHGLRISAFRLLASGSFSQSRSAGFA